MQRLSISLTDDRYLRIEKMVEDGTVKSKSKAVNKLINRGEKVEELQETINQLEDENVSLENRLEESRQREIARDNTNTEIARLRQDVEQSSRSEDAPFFIKWYRWYQNR